MKYTLGENKIIISDDNNFVVGSLDIDFKYLLYCDINNLKNEIISFIEYKISSMDTLMLPTEEINEVHSTLKKILYDLCTFK